MEVFACGRLTQRRFFFSCFDDFSCLSPATSPDVGLCLGAATLGTLYEEMLIILNHCNHSGFAFYHLTQTCSRYIEI